MRFGFASSIGLMGILTVVLVSAWSQVPPNDPYAAHVSRAGPRTPEEERKGFHVPPGFEVQLVAAEPFVRKPININFDHRGRLWVTESVEYPFAAPTGSPLRDTVRILEDTTGNGQADEVTTFTSGLNIPIGVLPQRDGALIYSIPNICRFHECNGTGRADGSEVLVGPFGFKDTHGMTGEFVQAFDGWIYACHGFANTSTIKGKDGSSITMQSGNTYRFQPDGTRLEQFTHGQVNPFGLTFDPLGNLYSCDCHSRPIYQLLRGAFYPSFGKPHDGLGFGPEVMTHDHGSTAIAGITYYAADHFPKHYHDTIFVGNVVTNRINHDRLEHHGSTVRALQQPDFLISDDPWFRPVDIKLGPDGALYVADFYNRIIGHYEVPLTHPGRDRERGRIWRIVYKGKDGSANPRRLRPDWTKASVAELAQDLGHANLIVRTMAAQELIERGGQSGVVAVNQLIHGSGTAFQKMHGLWVLERQHALDDATLAMAARESDKGLRVHSMRILAERPSYNEPLHQLVIAGLRDPDPLVRRCAADALGRHPTPANIRPLLDLYHQVPPDDTHLLHVVRMALRDQVRADSAWDQLLTLRWHQRDARAIADVAPGVPGPASAAFLLEHLDQFPETRANQLRYVNHIARYAAEGSLPDLVLFARRDRAAGLQHHLALFKAMQQGLQARGAPLSTPVRQWGEDVARILLASNLDNDVVAGIELSGSLRMETARDLMVGLAGDDTAPEVQRAAALAALLALDAGRYIPVVGRVLANPVDPMALRERAAVLLAGVNQPQAYAELLRNLATAPQRLARPIAYGLAANSASAEKLLDAVAAGKASARLLQEPEIRIRLERSKLPGVKERIAKLTEGLPSAAQRFDQLMNGRRTGFMAASRDPSIGAKVFEKHCAVCHQLANKGAKIGPQLDGIGIRGFDRILEDIVDPNRNVDQAFRLTTLELSSGQVVSGLLLREEGKVYVLADNQGKEVRVAKDAVAERTLSQLSPMPANLVDQIPEGDFYHLLAFLLAQQPNKTEVKKN
jgi:putative heme-binding domain-containing protein